MHLAQSLVRLHSPTIATWTNDVIRGVFHKGLRLVVRRVYSSQNPRTVRKSRTVRDSVSQRFPVAANCKYVQLTLSKPVRTRLEFSETDLRTVSGYDQFAVNSSQVEFLLRVRTNILVKHPPGQIPVKQANQVVHNFDNQYARTGGKRMSSVDKILTY